MIRDFQNPKFTYQQFSAQQHPEMQEMAANVQLVATGSAAGPDRVAPKSTQGFNFEELQELFLQKGLNALLERLKELKAAGIIEAIKVKTDAETGKTTVSCEFDGIEYEFTGVKGEKPEDTSTNPANEPVNEPVNNEGDTSDVTASADDSYNETFESRYELYCYAMCGEATNAALQMLGITEEEANKALVDILGCSNINSYVYKKFKDNYTQVTKGQVIEAWVNEYKAETNMSQTFTSEVNLLTYVISDECRQNVLQKLGLTEDEVKENCGITIGVITMRVYDKHSKDFGTLTRAQVIEEAVAEYNAQVKAHNSFTSAYAIKNYINDNADEAIKTQGIDTSKLTDDDIEQIIDSIWKKHKEDYKDVSKEQVMDEFISEIKNLIAAIEAREAEEAAREAARKESISNAAGTLANAIPNVISNRLSTILQGKATINTQITVNPQSGELVFSDTKAKEVFDALVKALKEEILKMPDGAQMLEKLGGESMLTRLVQQAWMSAYSSYPCNQNNNSSLFVIQVLNNLKAVADNIKNNPDNLFLYSQQSNLGSYITKDLPNYTNGIICKNTSAKNLVYNNNYKTTMTVLLTRLIKKYPNIPEATIKELFEKAKTSALNALSSGSDKDFPLNVAYDSVASTNYISMLDVVQLTLYYFDIELNNSLKNGQVNFTAAEDVPIDDFSEESQKKQLEEALRRVMTEDLNDIASEYPQGIDPHTTVDKFGNTKFNTIQGSNVCLNLINYINDELELILGDNWFKNKIDVRSLVREAWNKLAAQKNGSVNTAEFVLEVIEEVMRMIRA